MAMQRKSNGWWDSVSHMMYYDTGEITDEFAGSPGKAPQPKIMGGTKFKHPPLKEGKDLQAGLDALAGKMHHGGEKQTFNSGAKRDTAEDKPRPDLISPFATERCGEWLRLGAIKYAERNWEKGIPNQRCIASLSRHLMQYQQGDRSEDHLAAIMFNAMACMHNEEMVKRKMLPDTLLDMPNYTEACYTNIPIEKGAPSAEPTTRSPRVCREDGTDSEKE